MQNNSSKDRKESVTTRRGLARAQSRTPSPQHAVDETNRTQAGGGVVSQKVAKFTADDFTA